MERDGAALMKLVSSAQISFQTRKHRNARAPPQSMNEDSREAKRARRSVRLSGWVQSSAPAEMRSTVDISHLDGSCLGRILSQLKSSVDICNAMRTCKAMAEAGRSRVVWRELSLRLEDEKTVDEMEALHGGARETFKMLCRDPAKRFRFVKRIPTLGLNVSDNDLPQVPQGHAAVHGGFSFVPPTEGQAPTNRAGLADYNSFGVRELVFPRTGRHERLWLCEDKLTGEAKAVKVVNMEDKPNEGLPCRKLREVANLRALRDAPGIATLERTMTTSAALPLPRRSETEEWAIPPLEWDSQDVGLPDDSAQGAKLLLVHHYFPCNLRAQWTRLCGTPGGDSLCHGSSDALDGYAESCRPPVHWTEPTRKTLKRERSRFVMRKVLEALEHAHSRGICHRNLHSGHLLLDPEGEGRVAIASWSSSRRLSYPPAPVSPLRTCTVPYNVAPEGLLHHEKTEEDYFAGGPDNDPPPDNDGDDDGETYGPEVDVWSAGCIFAELHLGHSLFNKFSYAHGARTLDQLLSIFRLFGTPSRTNWDDIEGREGWSGDSYPHWTPRSLLDVFPEDAIGPLSADLLWRLMTLDPIKRITARQALSHPYFTAPIEADARRFVREDWSQPDVVGAVERGTKRMIRKRQLAERDEEAREAGEAGDDTSGSKREVEVEAPSDVATETNMAIRKDLLSLGLPLGRSVIGRYVIAKLLEHPMVGNIVAYDKVNNQYTVQWHDCHASREILKEEDVVRFLLI